MIRRLTLAALAIAAVPALAQDVSRSERVKFRPGTSAATLRGSVTGYASVKYLVGLRAGQTLSVRLLTDNASNSFNILPPGAAEAMYVGPTSGNVFRGKVLTGGDYTVQVYLTRSAARRGETANYALAIGATG